MDGNIDGKVEERNKRNAILFKINHILVSLFFFWLLVIHVIGLYFFAKGFLLSRLVLETKSQCSVLPDGSPSNVDGGCWHPKTFDRAVVIIIDALRYDFVIPVNATSDVPYYHNKLPCMYETAISHPENAILRPFIADPPTSTLQRLKGLTTGTLPVFIDIGSSFAGDAIQEDNILMQLRKAEKTIVHLGDDTWHALFPGYFEPNLTHAFDSFNVRDLHSVDTGVIQHIFPLLQGEDKWDVIFGHFLGVDHAGHRYGPAHEAMAEKLQQMDVVMREIMASIDDETLLVVMGDHGMDSKGDHGGESDDEVEAALFMYSKRPHFGRLQPADAVPPSTAKERPVGQIDLVSTLSILLGLPIPYNNLGTPIAEAFAGSGTVDWQNLGQVMLLAFHQIQKYHSEYSQTKDLGTNEQQNQTYLALQQALTTSPRKWQAVVETYQAWHTETIGMYRRLWANFNLVDMLHGIEILAGGLLVVLVVSRLGIGDRTTQQLPAMLRYVGFGTVGGAALGPLLAFAVPDYFNTIDGVMYALAVGSLVGAGLSLYQHKMVSLKAIGVSPLGYLSLMFTILQAGGFAANSFTIHEDSILLLFLTTFGIFAFLSSCRQAYKSDRILGMYHSTLFIFLTRAASFSKLCREEQMPGCRSTLYASQASSTAAPWHLFIPYAIALVLPELIKAFYKGTASYAGSAGFWIGFCFRVGLLLVAFYWTCDAIENSDWYTDKISKSNLETAGVFIARTVLAIAFPVGIGTFIWAHPCINIILKNPSTTTNTEPNPETSRPQLTVLGHANTFGSRYFLLLPCFVLSTILLLPPMGQFALAVCTWQILCLSEILDANGWTVSHTSFSHSSIGPIVLAMLGSYSFFKTGHQATLSSIQWNSAFIGFTTLSYPWAPLLVTLNTFGAQILCTFAVPLTVLWKRQISKDGLRGLWADVMNAQLTYSLYFVVIQLATTVWAGHLRRHLMLYRVFMPRFLMASGLLVIVDVVVLLGVLPAVRLVGLSVGEVFGY